MDKNLNSQEDQGTSKPETSKEAPIVNQEDSSDQVKQEEQTSQQEQTSQDIVDDSEEKPADEKSNLSFFKRKKNKENEKDEKIEELNDKLIRKAAEFDNFRKRSEKEKSAMYEIGAKSVIESILPVLDSFERGFDTVEEVDKDDAFVTGMEKVHKQLITNLDEIGVKPIEAVGKEFDPNLHNAVMHEDNPDKGDNIIVEEFQKGYTYKDTVVRYSMVKVAN